ncbi:MAG: flagellar assembly protein FliH [Rubrivivax sp.]|nr:flagellar assembly protein FliH [Rubrivivax sp.]
MTNNSSSSAKGPHPYTRFIPREELTSFAAWKPGSFPGSGTGAAAAAPAPAAPPPPTEAQWQARIAEARRAGVQEGYQNGYRDGLVALESFKQTFAAQTTAQVGALLTRLDAEFDALQPRLAEAVARAAVDLASQVLKSELKANPDVVAAVAQQALGAMLLSARHITLQLHPQDLPLVAEGAREALEARSARLVANPALARGDCIVESDVGTIDARIETLWAQATSGLEPAP